MKTKFKILLLLKNFYRLIIGHFLCRWYFEKESRLIYLKIGSLNKYRITSLSDIDFKKFDKLVNNGILNATSFGATTTKSQYIRIKYRYKHYDIFISKANDIIYNSNHSSYVEELKLLIVNEGKSVVQMITDSQIKTFELNFDTEKFDINNYSFDAKSLTNNIGTKLGKPGIILLNGEPGTGKTTFIRNLIHTYKDKRFLYLPPNMGNALSDPKFISMLNYSKDKIFIIEDGENILSKRTSGSNQAVSNILNLSDGILGDIFNITFIITINNNLKTLDPALLRSGRLMVKQEFTKLENGKTIAEVVNDDPIVDEMTPSTIGFKK